MSNTLTISLLYNIVKQKHAYITLEYKDESKLKWLKGEFIKMFNSNPKLNTDSLITPINQLLSTVDDLTVHQIQYSSKKIELKNNIIVSSSLELGGDCFGSTTNYFYERNEYNKIDILNYIRVKKLSENNKLKKKKTDTYLMIFKSENNEKLIMSKTVVSKNNIMIDIYYKFFRFNIHVSFKNFIDFGGKRIQIVDNSYDVDETPTRTTFFDFESNESIKNLLSKEIWVLKYNTSLPMIKRVFNTQ